MKNHREGPYTFFENEIIYHNYWTVQACKELGLFLNSYCYKKYKNQKLSHKKITKKYNCLTIIGHKGDYAYYGTFSNLGYEI
jgi:hypothetical protein